MAGIKETTKTTGSDRKDGCQKSNAETNGVSEYSSMQSDQSMLFV